MTESHKSLVAIALACAVLLTGCALFTRPTGTLSVERQKFINAYARVRITYSQLHGRMDDLCRTDKLPRDICANVEAIHQQAKTLDAEIQAKIDVPESEVDWDKVMRLMELTLGLVL